MKPLDVELKVQGQRIRLRIRAEKVFVTNLIGLFRATQLRVRPGETVLDVGTGAGLHSILAAKLGASRVFGIDPNPAAIVDARANARLNGVDKICRFFVGSMTEPARRRGIKADLIVSTLPNWRTQQMRSDRLMRRSPTLARHFNAGRKGMDLSVQLLADARRVLAPGGRIELHLVDWAGPEEGRQELRRLSYAAREIARASIPIWGRRNNLLSWLIEQGLPLRRRLDFGRFRKEADSLARVIEARLSQDAPPPARRLPARLEARWGAMDARLERMIASREDR